VTGTQPEQPDQPEPAVVRRDVTPAEARRASRSWWDSDAAGYLAEHGEFLGPVRFVWCPEGLDEATAGFLGHVRGRRVLEVGCGAAQCGRWLATQGADVVSLDLSGGMLARAAADNAATGVAVPLLQADACALPVADACVDLACSAFGAVPFVADSGRLMAEVARVLRPGGTWTFSVTHPLRWVFPDDPGPAGLVAATSYFDRTPYVEQTDGVVSYVEQHRTLGDRIREVRAAGLELLDLVEPEWVEGVSTDWGQWSGLRGGLFPGTAIFRTRKPG